MLRRHGVEEEPCTVRHSAIVSKSYRPGHPGAFLKRDAAIEGHNSGWYVGVVNDPLDFGRANDSVLANACRYHGLLGRRDSTSRP